MYCSVAKYVAIVRSGETASNGAKMERAPPARPWEANGSTTHAASTRPASSAAIMSGNGHLDVLDLRGVAAGLLDRVVDAERADVVEGVDGHRLALEVRGLLDRAVPGTSSVSKASSSDLWPLAPWETMRSGSFFDRAVTSETTLENPNW